MGNIGRPPTLMITCCVSTKKAPELKIADMPHRPAPQETPTGSEAALQTAAHALQNGRAEETERIAAEVLRQNPDDPRATYLYCHALFLQGRGPAAVEQLERALQRHRSPILETQIGMVLRQVGRLNEALKWLNDATVSQPPFPPAFLEQGSLLLQLNRRDDAIAVLERGLALAPNFSEILVQLGNAYAARGERTRATEFFARAIANLPNDPSAIFDYACIMKNSCCFAQAAELFKRVLAANPSDSLARLALGICLIESGQTEPGFENLSAASKTNAKMFGQTVNAIASAGKGRFWLRPSAARRFLTGSGV
jgi:tetratricopeptide (TPR) repeat protein